MPYIASITIDAQSIALRIPEVEMEKQQALKDLIAENIFQPKDIEGPYHLHLSITPNYHLCLTLQNTNNDNQKDEILLPLSRFRRIIKEYFIICENYFAATKNNSPAKIETIDMARRGIHNRGADLLYEHLKSKNIESNLDTARRLFTLICVLHIRQETAP